VKKLHWLLIIASLAQLTLAGLGLTVVSSDLNTLDEISGHDDDYDEDWHFPAITKLLLNHFSASNLAIGLTAHFGASLLLTHALLKDFPLPTRIIVGSNIFAAIVTIFTIAAIIGVTSPTIRVLLDRPIP